MPDPAQELPHGYGTVTEAVNDLVKRGYMADLQLCARQRRLQHRGTELELSPGEFSIDATYRFEGDTDPGDEMVVFAISSGNGRLKGLLVNGYGVYSADTPTALVSHLKTHLTP